MILFLMSHHTTLVWSGERRALYGERYKRRGYCSIRKRLDFLLTLAAFTYSHTHPYAAAMQSAHMLIRSNTVLPNQTAQQYCYFQPYTKPSGAIWRSLSCSLRLGKAARAQSD